ncbi:MAG: FAD-binding protein, partial [Christensenellales bacterium]
AKTFAENCGRAVDWLDTVVGVDFGERVPTYGGYVALNVPRVHYAVPADGDVSKSSGKGGSGYVKALSAKVDEGIANGNVCLMLDTQVTGVNYDGEKVTGVTATNAFGERTYDAPSVSLACGGYGGNEEMLKTYNFKNVLTTCADTARGDGYTFALELGAALSGMDWVSAYAGGINTGTFHKVLSANLYTNKQPIWVTMEGNRLTNEPVANSTDQSNAWNAATDNLVYIIFNDAMLEDPSTILYGVADLKAAWEEQLALGKNIWAADTIEELAQKAGIDAAGLTATVEAYNKACAGEAEDSFGRTENMIALENGGMIYAIKTMPYVMMTNGGVAMNENANIIREDGTPIVGLYQCGEQVGSDNIAGHSSVGGMAHGNCMTWGMISAENAVKHAQEQ